MHSCKAREVQACVALAKVSSCLTIWLYTHAAPWKCVPIQTRSGVIRLQTHLQSLSEPKDDGEHTKRGPAPPLIVYLRICSGFLREHSHVEGLGLTDGTQPGTRGSASSVQTCCTRLWVVYVSCATWKTWSPTETSPLEFFSSLSGTRFGKFGEKPMKTRFFRV